MRLAIAITALISTNVSGANDVNSHNGLRGQSNNPSTVPSDTAVIDGGDNPARAIPLDVPSRDGAIQILKGDASKSASPVNPSDEQRYLAAKTTSNKPRMAQFEEDENGKIRCIIEYKSGMKGKLMQGLAKDTNVHFEFDELELVVISIPAAALNGLTNNPNIVNISPDSKVELIESVQENGDPSLFNRRLFDPSSGGQWTPYGVNMLEVELLKKRGEDVKVCVLDTGYDWRHEDLPSASDVQWAVNDTHYELRHGEEFDLENPPIDRYNGISGCGHGTHVAGTIAMLDNDWGKVGVSPDVGLVIGTPLPNGQVWTTYLSNMIIDGILQCRARGAKIVNMSYGSSYWFNANEESMLSKIFNGDENNDGMLLIAGAGNHAVTQSFYPASYDSVIAAGAVDKHAVVWEKSARHSEVELVAPGVGVPSSVPLFCDSNYKFSWGTSMAAPHIAGVAARVWSIMPWLTAPQLRAFLVEASQPLDQLYTGEGLVQTGFYTIMLKLSGKCLDNSNGSIKLWTCGDEYVDQQFTFVDSMIVGNDGKCLHRPTGSWNGAKLHYVDCDHTQANQKWTYTDDNEFSDGDHCLQAHPDGWFKNGGEIYMWSCNGRPHLHQQWLLGKDHKTTLSVKGPGNETIGYTYNTNGAGKWHELPTAICPDGYVQTLGPLCRKEGQLTKVRIPKGFVLEYYEKPGFGGLVRQERDHSHEGYNGQLGYHDEVVEADLNGIAFSSFKVRKLPITRLVYHNVVTGKSRLWKSGDPNYYEVSDMSYYPKLPNWFGEGETMTQFWVPRGYAFQYFQYENFAGSSGTFCSCDWGTQVTVSDYTSSVLSFKIKVLDCDSELKSGGDYDDRCLM